MKNLIGRTIDDKQVQIEKDFTLGDLEVAEDGSVGYAVNYKGEDRVFSASTVMATLLAGLKRLAENSLSAPVRDVVIGVPGNYGDAQRRALINAARIAGLSCLRVMSEHTAVALDYGIYRQASFDETKPTNVVFVCGGQSLLIVSVVSFTKQGLKVLSDVIDVDCVGRNFDLAIIKKFTDPFDKKHNTDLLRNPKARLKLEEVASKAKKTLSANKEAPFSVECIYEEFDIGGLITREDFDEACLPFTGTLQKCVKAAIEKSGLPVDQIHSVELVGGCTRIPWVQNSISAAVPGVELCRTLHMDECVARGCVLQAAMLSPNYKVKEFAVVDRYSSEVCIRWAKEDGTMKDATVFPAGTEFGTSKIVTFERTNPMDIHLIVKTPADDGVMTEEDLGAYHIAVPAGITKQIKLKINVELDIHGRMDIVAATSCEEKTIVEKVKVKVDPPTSAPVVEEGAEACTPPAEPEFIEKEESKTVVDRKEVPVTAPARKAVMTKEQVVAAYESENAMYAADVSHIEVKERINELEALVYECRDLVNEYATETERNNLEKLIEETENWVYDVGHVELNREQIVAKLDHLKHAIKDVQLRKTEEHARKDHIPSFRSTLHQLRDLIDSEEDQYKHITSEKRQSASDALKSLEASFSDILAKQDVAPITSAPLFLVADIHKQISNVVSQIHKVMSAKAPKPKAVEKQDIPTAPEGDDINMDVEDKEAPAAGGADHDMDLD